MRSSVSSTILVCGQLAVLTYKSGGLPHLGRDTGACVLCTNPECGRVVAAAG